MENYEHYITFFLSPDEYLFMLIKNNYGEIV
jgi:hypothetical protein